ncbi:PAS domain-containing hybrid sensor histidine kinase/response regulator [Azospirillum sp.]|uniref:PAS domain-containing hybrid sensor histidine kinase/response regulator n=1 Tax=Azospirillum sp. TaxID=34012 RepID=UPI002D51F7A2|nr:ATP-binding protein [Azospirillum sp.]HYD65064.1 ATP-binding protein [Azospirillum sp.]
MPDRAPRTVAAALPRSGRAARSWLSAAAAAAGGAAFTAALPALLAGTVPPLPAAALAGGLSAALALWWARRAAATGPTDRDIIDATAQGYWEIDEDGRTVAVNGALCRMLGCAEADLLGREPGDFTDEEGRRIFAEQLASRAFLPQRTYDVVLLGCDGRRVEARFNATFRHQAGGLRSFALVTDITPLKVMERELRSEQERLRQIVGAVPVAMLVTRLEDGAVLHTNKAVAELFGLPPGAPVHSALDFYANPADRALVVAMVRAHGRIDHHEVLFRRADGTPWWALLSGQRFLYCGMDALLVGLQDLTATKKAQEALEAAVRAKSAFLATMSHEIRTPISGILGMTRLLLDSPLDSQQYDRLQTVLYSGEALLAILDDILDLSDMETERVTASVAPFDPRRLVRTAASLMSSRVAEKRISLDCTVADDVPRVLSGDARRLRRILLNLVGNAVKFTERGGVTVAAAMAYAGDGAPRLRVTVADTGVGIPQSEQAGLFESFYRPDRPLARRSGGTGLGLAMCKRLAEALGGAIGVDSTPGEGSRFWFELPVAPADGAAEEEPPAPGSAAPAPLDVLLAEDSEVNQLVALGFLKKLGHRAVVVGDGRAAVEAVQARRFDAVLMDLEMPVMDGLEATRAIRALDGPAAAVPIIALTADTLLGDADRCLAAGMNAYLMKPLNPRELQAVLARHCGAGLAAPVPENPLDGLVKRLGHETVGDLIRMFLTDGAALCTAIAGAAAESDLLRVRVLAHDLTAMASLLGLTALQRQSEAIEIACADNDQPDEIRILVSRLEERFARSRHILASFT